MEDRTAGRSLGTASAVLLAAAVVVLGAAGTVVARNGSEASDREDVARATVAFAAALDQRMDRVHAATSELMRRVSQSRTPLVVGQVTPVDGISSFAYLVADPPDVRVAAGTVSLSGADLSSVTLQSALDLARDTATPRLTPPIGSSDRVLYVTPVFTDGAGGLYPFPLTRGADDRRAALVGWTAAELDLDRLAAAAAPAGLDYQLTDGPTVVAIRGEPPEGDHIVRQTLDVGGRTWGLSAWSAGPGGAVPGTAYAVFLGSLAIAAVMVAGTTRRDRLIRDLRRTADARARQVHLITDLAPVVQRSIDLGEVLPAIAVRLMDELDLAAVGFSLAHHGRYRDVFTTGSVQHQPPTLTLPDHMDTGQSVSLALQRAGRTSGLFHIRAGRQLSKMELEAAKAAADLAAAAIISAEHYEQQEEIVQRLRAVDELKTVFLGTASHELRTPVTAITGFSSLLNSNWDRLSDDERRLFAGRIHANAGALDRLVQDLLDFSRLERGRVAVATTPMTLGAAVVKIVERLSPVFDTHTITTHITSTRSVMADTNGFERIFTNLLSNAVKFSPEGSTVTVTVADDGDEVVLTIDDEGPGVPEDERTHIFSRFFRGAGQEVLKTRGAGIGLAVVAEFVDQMGGTVSVGESPAGGARFEIRMRVAPGPAPKETVESDEETSDGPTP